MDDTAATLQQEYDWAVHDFGVNSWQAIDAQFEARQYFKKADREQSAAISLSPSALETLA